MNYIVLDLEFNQAYDFKTNKPTELNTDCPFEIIQIGAVKLSDNMETSEFFDCLIKPQLYKRIHPFVKKITGFRTEDFDDSPFFPEAYKKFADFIGDSDSILCTWGGDDIKALFRNIIFHKLDTSAIPNKYINIQKYASKYLKYGDGNSIGLKNAVELLNIKIGEDFHNALNDADYTAKIFKIVKPEEILPIVFTPEEITAKKERKVRISIKALKRNIQETMGRELTPDESQIMKLAYKLGRNRTFDIASSESGNIKHDKSGKESIFKKSGRRKESEK